MNTIPNDMGSHTPEPWECSLFWDDSGMTNNTVYHAPGPGQDWKKDTAVICTLPPARLNRANALLIVAAPALLKAADSALALLEENREAWGIRADGPVFDLLRDSIAKATGSHPIARPAPSGALPLRVGQGFDPYAYEPATVSEPGNKDTGDAVSAEARAGASAALPGLHRFKCPQNLHGDTELRGCGAEFEGAFDEEGLVDCPVCGIWFRYDEPGVMQAAAQDCS